jgi:CheY-like chemotaxis protein
LTPAPGTGKILSIIPCGAPRAARLADAAKDSPMPKKILLIENDSAFAEGLTQALETTGFDVRATGDGKEGLDLAREWDPTAIVLCVELPGMSGYLVCQKLRKDDALKAIPLVLTSAEATADTFEKHKALKVRADEYLLKPYDPSALVEKLDLLVGLPEGAPVAEVTGEEELVSLEEEMGLEALPAEAEGELPALDLQSLPEEAAAATGDDETLALLDDAFAGLTARPPDAAAGSNGDGLELDLDLERPLPADELDAAAASLPDDGPAMAAAFGLDDADAALGALAADDPAADEPLGLDLPVDLPPQPSRTTVRGASADLLRAAGIKLLDDEPLAPPPPARAAATPDRAADRAAAATLDRLERELAEARQEVADAHVAVAARDGELAELRGRVEAADAAAASRDSDLAAARSKIEAADARARKAEADLKTARDAAGRTEAQLVDVKARLGDAERRAEEAEARVQDAEVEARRKGEELTFAQESLSKAEALEREAEELRTELVVARGEAEGARGEVEKRTLELKKRVQELEAANAKNEERVLKAYQKIKNDEKVREKVRKAVAIAGQLLDEGLPPAAEPPHPEKATGVRVVAAAAAGLMGRE